MLSKKILVYALVSSLAIVPAYSETAAPEKAAPKASAVTAKAAKNIEALMALVPNEIAEYTVDGQVKKVTTKYILKGLRIELNMAAQNGREITPSDLKRFLPVMAEKLVMEKVLPLVASKQGFKPDMAIVRKELAELKSRGTEAQFKEFLKSQDCATEEDFVKQIAPRQAVQAYVKSIGDSIKIDDKEIKAEYDKHLNEMKYYECSHILAAFDAKNPSNEKITPAQEAAALKKIQDIKAKLDKGAKFEDLAKAASDCPSGKSGGKLGVYSPVQKMLPGQMVQEFTEAFNKLKPGEVTAAPVKTQFGYHLIKASGVKIRTLQEVTPVIKGQLKNQQFQKKIDELLKKVKADYKVKYYVK